MKKRNLIIFAIAAIFIAIIFLPGYSKLQQLRQHNRELKAKIEKIKKENLFLRAEKENWENDPLFLERLAREKIGLVKEDEIIYKLVPKE